METAIKTTPVIEAGANQQDEQSRPLERGREAAVFDDSGTAITYIPDPAAVGQYLVVVRGMTAQNIPALSRKVAKLAGVSRVAAVGIEPASLGATSFPVKAMNENGVAQLVRQVAAPGYLRDAFTRETIIKGEYLNLRPVTAELVPALNCNYRCVQCAYAAPKQEMGLWMGEPRDAGDAKFQSRRDPGTQMTLETMERVVDGLVAGGVQNILVTGGGEPLINPNAIKALEHAKARGATVALYTNAFFLNQQKAERLMETDPLFIRCSVYGGSNRSCNEYTQLPEGARAYTRVVRNIARLARLKHETGTATVLGLSYLLHPITIPSILSFARSIAAMPHNEQIDYIRFTPAVDYWGGTQHDAAQMRAAFQTVEREVMNMFRGSPTTIKPYHHRLNDLHASKPYTRCRASGYFVEVAPSGEVFLCCEKHFLPNYKIGDLTTQTLDEIWKSDRRREVIQRVNAAGCSSCPTLCKPHELNKIFEQVEMAREAGEMDRVVRWADHLVECGAMSGYCPGKLDDFQS